VLGLRTLVGRSGLRGLSDSCEGPSFLAKGSLRGVGATMSLEPEERSATERRIAELTARMEKLRSQVDSANIGEWLEMFREREVLAKLHEP
jgi:hypothetical protein